MSLGDGGLFLSRFPSPLPPPCDAARIRGLKGDPMANHLTPEELSKELGIDRQEVIRLCIEESVPIYHGKIDKTLFAAQLAAVQSGGDD
jgi:hypothetical protein